MGTQKVCGGVISIIFGAAMLYYFLPGIVDIAEFDGEEMIFFWLFVGLGIGCVISGILYLLKGMKS